MTDLVMKPDKAPVVQGRGLYRVYMNKRPLDLRFRAKNAAEADAMLQYLLVTQTAGKTLMVPEEYLTGTGESDIAADGREKDREVNDE